MTDPNGWPDPARPGVPLSPDAHGWHWVSWDPAWPEPAYWDGEWSQPEVGKLTVKQARYIGPLYTPAEVAALVAAGQEAMRAWLKDALRKCHAGRRTAREKCNNDECTGCPACDEYRDADIQAMCYSHALEALNAVSAPDALARIRAEAERRGMERAAEIAGGWRDGNPDAVARCDWTGQHIAAAIRAAAIRAAAKEIKA
jgi:hypothetical protein